MASAFRDRVLALLEQPPPKGRLIGMVRHVALDLGCQAFTRFGRVLRREGIYLQRLRTWWREWTDLSSHRKRADVDRGCYLNSYPLNALC